METAIEFPEVKERVKKEKPAIKRIILTLEQKTKILGLINLNPTNPPSLKELTDNLYPDQDLDGRSFEGKAVKEYCATYN